MASKNIVFSGRRSGRAASSSVSAGLKANTENDDVLKVFTAGRSTGVIKMIAAASADEPQKPLFTQPLKALLYQGKKSIDDFVRFVYIAPPMQLLETERKGVDVAFLGDMAERMDVSFSHLAETVGIPKATAARKLAKNEPIDGAAAIALARLLAIANEIVEDSAAPEAKKFDTAKWLGQWIERPQPALGGRKPSELLDTPTGVAMVTKVLGAIRSGAYQ